jgi:hypothetical protein
LFWLCPLAANDDTAEEGAQGLNLLRINDLPPVAEHARRPLAADARG